MIKVKLLDKIYDSATSFYRIELPNSEVLFERLDESELRRHRGSERDVVTKLAMEYAESKGFKNLEVKFV